MAAASGHLVRRRQLPIFPCSRETSARLPRRQARMRNGWLMSLAISRTTASRTNTAPSGEPKKYGLLLGGRDDEAGDLALPQTRAERPCLFPGRERAHPDAVKHPLGAKIGAPDGRAEITEKVAVGLDDARHLLARDAFAFEGAQLDTITGGRGGGAGGRFFRRRLFCYLLFDRGGGRGRGRGAPRFRSRRRQPRDGPRGRGR